MPPPLGVLHQFTAIAALWEATSSTSLQFQRKIAQIFAEFFSALLVNEKCGSFRSRLKNANPFG